MAGLITILLLGVSILGTNSAFGVGLDVVVDIAAGCGAGVIVAGSVGGCGAGVDGVTLTIGDEVVTVGEVVGLIFIAVAGLGGAGGGVGGAVVCAWVVGNAVDGEVASCVDGDAGFCGSVDVVVFLGSSLLGTFRIVGVWDGDLSPAILYIHILHSFMVSLISCFICKFESSKLHNADSLHGRSCDINCCVSDNCI